MPREPSAPEPLPVYSADEVARIAAAGLPVWGSLQEHPVLAAGGRRYRPISFPEEITKLNMEATDNRCNLRCSFCFQSERYVNSRRRERYMRMPPDAARRIVDALPNLQVFVPYSINEPGMVPENLAALLPYVWERRRARVFVSTNLSLPWKNYGSWIATSGVERVIVGGGGASKATHELHRPGSRWEVMLANVARLLELRAREGWPRHVEYQVILTRDNEAELDRFEGFARGLGVQSLQVKTLALKTADSRTLVALDPRLRRDQGRGMDRPCAYPFEALTVVLSDHNGRSAPGPKVAMCVCGYFDPPQDLRYIRGDLLSDDIFLAMNDPELQRARAIHLTRGMRGLPVCVRCGSRKPLGGEYVSGGTLRLVPLMPAAAPEAA